jgi:hypothetical protein
VALQAATTSDDVLVFMADGEGRFHLFGLPERTFFGFDPSTSAFETETADLEGLRISLPSPAAAPR